MPKPPGVKEPTRPPRDHLLGYRVVNPDDPPETPKLFQAVDSKFQEIADAAFWELGAMADRKSSD